MQRLRRTESMDGGCKAGPQDVGGRAGFCHRDDEENVIILTGVDLAACRLQERYPEAAEDAEEGWGDLGKKEGANRE